MGTVRFTRIALDYGCHSEEFDLPTSDRPVMICGPNGSGKSTLLEGLVRILFGFDRRKSLDRGIVEARRPWSGEVYRGRLDLIDADGAIMSIARDFESNEVEVRVDRAGIEEVWAGDGNPSATNQEAREYRRLLRSSIGLNEITVYERTACVHQGQLTNTSLGDELLQAAAGGGVDVEKAKESVAESHRQLTVRAISGEGRRAVKLRALEKVEKRIAEIEERLEKVRMAETRRKPLLEEESELNKSIERLDAEIHQLEQAQDLVATRRVQESEIGNLEMAIRDVENMKEKIDKAYERLRRAEERFEGRENLRAYPDDLPQRVPLFRRLRDDRERLATKRDLAAANLHQMSGPSWILLAGTVATLLTGIGVLAAGNRPIGGGLTVLGLLATVALAILASNRRRTRKDRLALLDEIESELAEVDAEIEKQAAGIPNAEEIDDFAPLLDEFEKRREAREFETKLSEIIGEAQTQLEGADARLPDDPELLLKHIADRIVSLRNHLAEVQYAVGEVTRPILPEGVEATIDSVQVTLLASREKRRNLQGNLDEARANLLEEGRPETTAATLEQELLRVREREGDLLRSVEIFRHAFRLIDEAHQQFREKDQERLVTRVSEHLARVSAGVLGPLEVPGELKDAKLRAFGRQIALAYRPLSYGQWHAALIALRLGATDFLAHAGVRVPLIIDEPFANLDDKYDQAVWRSLCNVAQERQVIVATQEEAMLDRLDITPDILLERAAPSLPHA